MAEVNLGGGVSSGGVEEWTRVDHLGGVGVEVGWIEGGTGCRKGVEKVLATRWLRGGVRGVRGCVVGVPRRHVASLHLLRSCIRRVLGFRLQEMYPAAVPVIRRCSNTCGLPTPQRRTRALFHARPG